MTNFLRKLFIKDFNNVENPSVRKKHGLLASFVGAISNLILCTIKIIIGLIVGSMTIITDAINNLTDMGSCFVNIFGFKMSSKPADKKHPFGHERIEYIAGLIISFIIIALAVLLGYTSVLKIINKDWSVYTLETFIVAIIILVIAILVKLWQGLFYKKIGKIINSVSLKASSQDSINDVITTSVVLVATILEFILQDYDVHLDAYFSIGVALFIVISGIKLVIETANPLIGITPDNDLVKKAIDDILKYDGVLGVHDLMCHSYGPTKIFMTIHVEVDASVDVLISHDLIDNIENEVGKNNNLILTIHMDPIETQSEEINELKAKTLQFLNEIDNNLTFHDFRIVRGNTHTNVLFDVVIPFEYDKTPEELTSILKDKFKTYNSHYNLVIKIDHDYTSND